MGRISLDKALIKELSNLLNENNFPLTVHY